MGTDTSKNHHKHWLLKSKDITNVGLLDFIKRSSFSGHGVCVLYFDMATIMNLIND